jgi:hypothetical protein
MRPRDYSNNITDTFSYHRTPYIIILSRVLSFLLGSSHPRAILRCVFFPVLPIVQVVHAGHTNPTKDIWPYHEGKCMCWIWPKNPTLLCGELGVPRNWRVRNEVALRLKIYHCRSYQCQTGADLALVPC